MTSPCPSRFELSRLHATGLLFETQPHLLKCARCRDIINELEDSKMILLGSDPETASAQAAHLIAVEARVRQQRAHNEAKHPWWRWVSAGALALSAAAALLWIAPNSQRLADTTVRSEAHSVRAKGSLAFSGFVILLAIPLMTVSGVRNSWVILV